MQAVMRGVGFDGVAILLAAVVMGDPAAPAPASGSTNWAVLIQEQNRGPFHDSRSLG